MDRRETAVDILNVEPWKKGYEQSQGRTSRSSRPCDEKEKVSVFSDNRKNQKGKGLENVK